LKDGDSEKSMEAEMSFSISSWGSSKIIDRLLLLVVLLLVVVVVLVGVVTVLLLLFNLFSTSTVKDLFVVAYEEFSS